MSVVESGFSLEMNTGARNCGARGQPVPCWSGDAGHRPAESWGMRARLEERGQKRVARPARRGCAIQAGAASEAAFRARATRVRDPLRAGV